MNYILFGIFIFMLKNINFKAKFEADISFLNI